MTPLVWKLLRSTLLGAAFRVGDVTEVTRLTLEVAREGPAAWELDSTLQDITDTVEAITDSETRQQLAKHREELAALLRKP